MGGGAKPWKPSRKLPASTGLRCTGETCKPWRTSPTQLTPPKTMGAPWWTVFETWRFVNSPCWFLSYGTTRPYHHPLNSAENFLRTLKASWTQKKLFFLFFNQVFHQLWLLWIILPDRHSVGEHSHWLTDRWSIGTDSLRCDHCCSCKVRPFSKPKSFHNTQYNTT